METNLVIGMLGPALPIIPIVIAVVTALKQGTNFVTNKNAALASLAVGILLSIGANLTGIYEPVMTIAAAGFIGALAGLAGTGAYASVKHIGEKKKGS